MPLHFYERPILLPVSANLKKSKEDFHLYGGGGGGENATVLAWPKSSFTFFRKMVLKIQTNFLANLINLVRLAIQVIMHYSHSVTEEKVIIAVS